MGKQKILFDARQSKYTRHLMIPENHLLTEESNATIYYTRLADELLRHNRVHLFMFYPDQYLNIQSQEYQIEDATEMVVPKFLLTADQRNR